ncbi:hypothetical protein BKA57DRAFT_452108 [Linnemannia elongata]|nr:hypothetical protein BKA57DRAFT_452108 [Linnemannia elongata]
MPISSCAGITSAFPSGCPGSLRCCINMVLPHAYTACLTEDGRHHGDWKPIITCNGTSIAGKPIGLSNFLLPDNFQCCITPCTTNDGRSGSCTLIGVCNGTSIAGLCPGLPSNVQCCLSGSSFNSFNAKKVIACARIHVKNSVPYSWGGGHGKTPGPSLGTCVGYTGKINPCPAKTTVGLDCSGLVRDALYCGTGIDLGPGPSAGQLKDSHVQSIQDVDRQPGDLEFFRSPKGKINHVILYIGKNSAGREMMIEAKETGTNVHEVRLRKGGTWVRFR